MLPVPSLFHPIYFQKVKGHLKGGKNTKFGSFLHHKNPAVCRRFRPTLHENCQSLGWTFSRRVVVRLFLHASKQSRHIIHHKMEFQGIILCFSVDLKQKVHISEQLSVNKPQKTHFFVENSKVVFFFSFFSPHKWTAQSELWSPTPSAVFPNILISSNVCRLKYFQINTKKFDGNVFISVQSPEKVYFSTIAAAAWLDYIICTHTSLAYISLFSEGMNWKKTIIIKKLSVDDVSLKSSKKKKLQCEFSPLINKLNWFLTTVDFIITKCLAI